MSQAMQSNEPKFTISPVSDVIGAEVVGLDVSGCRLAFDLGKSDFKVVACIDGKVRRLHPSD